MIRFVFSACWLSGLVCFFHPATALSQTDEQTARSHDRRAAQYFSEGQFLEALQQLQAAELTLPAAPRRYNIGLCLERLGRFDEAIEAYEHFLTAADQWSERAEVVRQRLDVLRAHTGEDLPEPPGDDARFHVDHEGRRRQVPRPVFYGALSTALVAGLATLTVGLVAQGTHLEFVTTCPTDPRGAELSQRGRSLTVTTDVLLGITVVTVMATTILAFFTSFDRDDHIREFSVAPSLWARGGALVASARF